MVPRVTSFPKTNDCLLGSRYFLSSAHTVIMAYSYKGGISFGLVYIPVTLHSTIKENDIGFNMIDKKTMSRVKYKKTCADYEGREAYFQLDKDKSNAG